MLELFEVFELSWNKLNFRSFIEFRSNTWAHTGCRKRSCGLEQLVPKCSVFRGCLQIRLQCDCTENSNVIDRKQSKFDDAVPCLFSFSERIKFDRVSCGVTVEQGKSPMPQYSPKPCRVAERCTVPYCTDTVLCQQRENRGFAHFRASC